MKFQTFVFLSLLIVISSVKVNKSKLKDTNNFVVKPDSNFIGSTDKAYYIDLPNENYFTYTLPTRSPFNISDSSIRTVFTKIRVDPWTLKVHTGDFKYSTSTGKVSHFLSKPNEVPYATAFGCERSYFADGEGKIDLRGTPYAVDDVFTHSGYESAGSVTVSDNAQVVLIKGGGYCGWIAPKDASGEVNAHMGGWFLQLKLLSNSPFETDKDGNSWLSLPNKNTSGYKLPSRKPWGIFDSDLTVTWNKIKIDPKTLAIFTNDYTHTTSVGKVSHDNGFVYVSFGAARGCESPYNADGTAVIDLNGTPVHFADGAESKWAVSGYQPAGKVTIDSNRKVAIITGGGYCGWNALTGGYAGGKVEGLLKLD